MAKSQGAQANKNGKVFEEMLLPVFQRAGFEIFMQGELKKKKIQKKLNACKRYVIKQATYTTIYNHKGQTEYVIVSEERRIRVEVKYQAASGSVDEKYPYMLLNGIYQYPENEVVFIVDGGGFKPGAKEWIKKQLDDNWLDYKSKGKDIKLMSITEFVSWFNRQF